MKILINIKIETQDETFQGKVDPDEFFICDIAEAVRSKRNPVEKLIELANKGSKST